MIKTDTFKQRILGVFSVVSQKLSNPKQKATALVVLFAIVGAVALVFTHAATIATSLEAESGTLDALGCAVVNLAFIPYYPIWSILLVVINVVVIYALTVHGRDIVSE